MLTDYGDGSVKRFTMGVTRIQGKNRIEPRGSRGFRPERGWLQPRWMLKSPADSWNWLGANG
ncbi:MAG: hypothetical protein DWI22_11930 [Planctomycetota bacterium]|nr:MAG: hypothetical protein DWI22_11930 [Planctomycetota bacterium]